MKKRDFFSKITVKNYNNELENVLEKKKFSVNVKNLLLSMLYKIEVGYEDYKIVKQTPITKGQVIENIIDIIEYGCEQIELVEPTSKKGKVLSKFNMTSVVDKTYNTIISYPIEQEILYALCELQSNSFNVKDSYYIVKKTLPILFKIGSNINEKEIIRDFNGWSWEIDAKNIENFEYNLIYQNIRILLGSDFLYNWKMDKQERNDYLLQMKEKLRIKCKEDNAEEFYNTLVKLSIALGMNNDAEIKKEILNERKKVMAQVKLMEDKSEFVNSLTDKKRILTIEIKKIDKILNSRELLKQELAKRNENTKDKISSIETLKFSLRNERKALLEELNENTQLMNPKKYQNSISNLERRYELLKEINSEFLSNEGIENTLIDLQKIFLECLKTRIEYAKTKSEVIELIYHLRYYKKMAIKENTRIGDLQILRKAINEIEEAVISKGINLKALNLVAKGIDYNISIIKEVLNSKIINLENIEIEIKPENNILNVSIYDGEILENEYKFETMGDASKILIKANKKIKLFM